MPAEQKKSSIDKITELANVVSEALSEVGVRPNMPLALAITQNFATVTLPEERRSLDLITLRPGGGDRGVSTKPGNILLDIRKLIAAIAEGVLTTVGVLGAPWTAVFGALVLWNTLYDAARVTLSERDASVIWTLWQLKDANQTVANAGLLHQVNTKRKVFGRSEITPQELNDSLENLADIRAIERSSNDPSRWFLREWVRVTY